MMRTRYAGLWCFCLLAMLSFAASSENAKASLYAEALPATELPTRDHGVNTLNGVSVPWEARHGLSAEQYQATFDDLGSQGYRLTQVTGYAYNNTALYAAIWEKRGGPAYEVRHGLTNAQYQQFVNEMIAGGYRPLWVSGYTVNNEDRYATIWEQTSAPAWIARHGLNSADYQAAFVDYANQGYRLVQVSGYAINNQDYYAAIWEIRDSPAWQARHGLSAADYQATVDQLKNQGFRPVLVHGYSVNNEARFATIWEQSVGPLWEARHGLTNAQYQATFTDLAIRGYKLKTVSGYTVGGQDYYAAIWEQTVQPFSSLPMTGNAVPELAIFDQTMQDFMVARQIPAGTLVVMKDGEIVLERGYGWQDRDQTVLLPHDAMLRLASIIKPVTAAAILKLIDEGKLNANDRVFCLTGSPSNCILNITPSGTEDANAVNITIQHLLDHEGGWDRDASFDPMFRVITIANDLGVTSPPSKVDIVRYMLGKPLDFVPGADYAYSNFGYLLLGLVVEEITGKTFTSYIQNEIFAPLCVPKQDIQLGRSLPNQRNLREPWYSDPNTATEVFDTSKTILFPDGGFYIEAMEAHGGMIAAGTALAEFLQAYWIDGQPRSGNGQDWTFFGSLPGTHTLVRQRADGINIVALFNQRTDPSGANYEVIKDLLDSAANSVTTWPATTQAVKSGELPDLLQQAICFFPPTSLVVNRSGGTLGSINQAITVVFPEDAVTEPVSVTLRPMQLVAGDDYIGAAFFALSAVGQELQPVTTFPKPVKIMTVLPDDLDAAPEEFDLYYYSEEAKQWIKNNILSILSVQGGIFTLISEVSHFSTFAVLAEVEEDPGPDPGPEPGPTPEHSIHMPFLRN